jgi:hypothetical protein
MSGDDDNSAQVHLESAPAWFPAISTRHGNIAIVVAIAIAGLLFAWQSSLLEFGTLTMPGAGFVPLILSVATVALAAVIFVRERQQPDTGEKVALGHRDVVIVFAAMLAIPVLFEPLGAYVTLGLFGAVLLVLIARTSLLLAVISAIVAMVACWFFFQIALGLQLPIGSVWDWFTQLNG